MKGKLKKILVILPVGLLTLFYLKAHYRSEFMHASTHRIMLFGLTILVLYVWILVNVFLWNQKTLLKMLMQSSFFVYIFMVLTLTGYFVLFREISAHSWYSNMLARIHHKDHVNLTPFQMFKIYKSTDAQVVGNFIMLLPLGIYLPLLYRSMNDFFMVLLVSFFTSLSIELLQLATRFRSADIDDIILNTAGAVAGFALLKLVLTFKPKVESSTLRTT